MDACRVGVDNWFRRCFHNCKLQDCRDGSQFGEKQPVRIIVSAGRWDTPHIDSFYSPYSAERALGRPFSGVVATCPKTGTGYHLFPQVRAFTPHTGGIYSPLLATRVVATFWLPTGYHPEQGFRGLFSDVAAWVKTRWTWKHGLEMLELLSGSSLFMGVYYL